MASKHHFFQLGPVSLNLPHELAHGFTFEWVDNDGTYMPDEDQLLFVDGRVATPYRNKWFLIAADADILDDPKRLVSLPANLIVLDQAAKPSKEARRILSLKQAHWIDFTDREGLIDFLAHDCFDGQQGGAIDPDNVWIDPNFTGQVTQNGHVSVDFSGDFDNATTPLMDWRMVSWGLYDSYFDIVPELQVSGDVQLEFQLVLIDSKSMAITKRVRAQIGELKDGIRVYTEHADQMMQVSLFASGSGEISVGQVHARLSRQDHGVLFPGGERLVDPHGRRTELLSYFDAGDLKPPLMVYFSGFRTAEGFEANFLMQHFKSPFMIFGDPRLEGGAFYMGSDDLERQVLETIQRRLDQLGFTSDQVVLAGLSMGTTAALYYSAQLKPHAVVVGKPLASLGDIAANERINRPGGFPTSFDLLRNNGFEVSTTGVDAMNRRFWDHFERGDVQKTLFVVAYMEDDDYDATGFSKLFAYLTTKFPGIRLWHKGLVGRHNDDTPGITTWFIRQIERILTTDFDRNFKEA